MTPRPHAAKVPRAPLRAASLPYGLHFYAVAATSTSPLRAGTTGVSFAMHPLPGDDERVLIVHRGKKNYIILNRYPYTSGHVMIVPYAHLGTLPELEPSAGAEMMEMAQLLERAMESLYHPQGYNLGMNIGRAAARQRIVKPSAHACAAALDR